MTRDDLVAEIEQYGGYRDNGRVHRIIAEIDRLRAIVTAADAMRADLLTDRASVIAYDAARGAP